MLLAEDYDLRCYSQLKSDYGLLTAVMLHPSVALLESTGSQAVQRLNLPPVVPE